MRTLFIMLLAWALVACTTTSRDDQIERVAKDWSQTIRASQIIPVYPLTQDVQPGDIFLVQRTVQEQHLAYQGDGFLALDHHIERVDPSGYKAFYQNSFWGDDGSAVPPGRFLRDDPGWQAAPLASFPSYSFSIDQGGAISAALPVEGINIGLSLLAAKSGSGTVTIRDARTYGVATTTLAQDVRAWAARHKTFLANYAPEQPGEPAEHRNFLRVISRVYVTRGVSISLYASETFGAGADVQSAVTNALLSTHTPANEDGTIQQGQGDGAQGNKSTAYANAVDALNASISSLDNGEAGGAIRVVAASLNAIGLNETLPEPLVIGYLGFDIPILRSGDLGPSIPTYAVLERGAMPQLEPAGFTASQQAHARALRMAEGRSTEFYERILLQVSPPLADDFTPPSEPYNEFRRVLNEWRVESADWQEQEIRTHEATRAIQEALQKEER